MTATAFGAIPAGTDLSSHAHELRRIHDSVLAGVRPPARPRPLVARSWSRMMTLGLDPDGRNERSRVDTAEIERLRHASALNLVIDDLRSVLTRVADASTFVMVVCDPDGVVLWREGSPRVRHVADRLGFAEGARWSEQTVGTNAIGTALAEAAPVELFSAEHFEQQQHPWYCTAAPVHDPRSGDLIGVVDVSGPAMTLHPAIAALVESAVRLAEAQLWRRHQAGLERLRRAVQPVVGAAPGPLLVVDDHGWVAHCAGVAARDRIEKPQADRPLAVPGLGLCLPEPVGEGWLIRPQGGAASIATRLDLTTPPLLEVRANEDHWRVPLSRRHAQILEALAGAGAEGLSAAQLSDRLFGDPEHAVTVRAEVSRLRRVVGALVTTNPYRVAPDVALQVVHRS